MSPKNRILLALALLVLAVPLVHAADFELATSSYSPAPATPGQLLTLYLNVENASNTDSGQVTVTVKPEYPFSLSTSDKSEKVFPTILARQTQLAILEVQVDKGALNGTYTIEVRVTEDNHTTIGIPLTIQIASYKPQVEVISVSQDRGSPGEVMQNELTIQNIGSSNAKNIFVRTNDDRTVTTTGAVVERPIQSLGTGIVFVENLAPSESRTFPIELGIDSLAEQKTHLVPVTIKFEDENRTEYEVTRYIGINVAGSAELDGTLTSAQTIQAFPGSESDFSVNLFNRGTATAHNIVVEVVDNPIWTIQTEKKVFIGTLDADDFDSFNLTAKISPNAKPGSYPITLRFEYKNQDYQPKTEEKTVMLEVFNPQDANSGSGSGGNLLATIIIVVVVLVVAYLGYKRFFGKKK